MSDKSLLDLLKKAFEDLIESDPKIAEHIDQLTKDSIGYEDGLGYSTRIGDLSMRIFEQFANDIMDDQDAYDAIMQFLKDENYAFVSDYAMQIQKRLNEDIGVNLRAQEPVFNGRVASEIAHDMNHADDINQFMTAVRKVGVFTDNVCDDTMKANVSFQWKAGLSPQVVRIAERGACKWCLSLAGSYDAPVPDDVYKRHDNCKCVVKYKGKKLKSHGKNGKTFRDGDISEERREELREQSETEDSKEIKTYVSGARKSEGDRRNDHANLYYDEVRNRKPYFDAKKIASNVEGFTTEEVEEIRNHLFINEYVINGEKKRFSPDWFQAQSWQRLCEGKNIKNSDIVLLYHERYEISVMKENGYDFDDAHNKASEVFNYSNELRKEGLL